MAEAFTIGISLGSIYGLVAIGFSLIYRTTGVLNFSQGAFVMLGGIGAAWTSAQWGWSLPLALIAGVILAVLSGLILALTVVFPLWRRRASEFTTILGTLLFFTIAENLVLYFVGSEPQTLNALTPQLTFSLGTNKIESQTVWTLIVAILLTAILVIFLYKTKIGTAMRACSVDRSTSRLLGISPNRIALIAFALAALTAGIGGVLIVPIQATVFNVGEIYNINGFLAAIIGGLGDVRGALVGGIIVGLFEAFVGIYISTSYLNLIVLVLLIAVLIVRPHGIFAEAAH